VIIESKKRHGDVVKNSFNGRHVFNKSLNEDPRLLAIIHGMLMMRVPFDRKPRPDGTKPRPEKMRARYWRRVPSR